VKQVVPLYNVEEAEQALTHFRGQPYRYEVTIGKDMTCTFYDAGHIIGSAVSIVKTRKDGRVFTVAFSGDIGRYDTPIIKDPTSDFAEEDRDIDLLIMESTYGDRLHAPIVDMAPMLKQVIDDTHNGGGPFWCQPLHLVALSSCSIFYMSFMMPVKCHVCRSTWTVPWRLG
jgi:metallo-beta-lactamase family protein